MRKKEHIDYIYCTCKAAGWQWAIARELECCVLQMELGKLAQKTRKRKVAKLLRRFEAQNAVIGADAEAAKLLELEEALFAARQQELLLHQEDILHWLLSPNKNSLRGRRRLLIVWEDSHWGHKELWQCIAGAKDWFEDIAVCMMRKNMEMDHMVEDIYEEWGLVIELLSIEQLQQRHFHMIYFLVVRWTKSIRLCCHYNVAYLVSYEQAEEEEYIRKGTGKLYDGLEYAVGNQKIRRDYARNLALQRPDEYQKKGVSVVAICERE